jgi:hypothetical protein
VWVYFLRTKDLVFNYFQEFHTIVEKVICMLKMAKLLKQFWGETVRTACYLINWSPSVPLKFEIPERVWSKKNVSYSHLRVFGCKAYVHIPKEQRSKLDDKATPYIFLGYRNEEFGYRLWDPEKRRIVTCKDVVFYEYQIGIDLNNDKKSERVGESIELTSVPSLVQSAATDEHESNEEDTEETSDMIDSDDDDDVVYDAPK